jgi:hypothetical protein
MSNPTAAKTTKAAVLGIVWVVTVGGASTHAFAAPAAGTLADPYLIDAFPYAHAADTSGGAREIDAYACADWLDECGPERVYRLTLNEAGRLTAWVEGDGGGVDIDVHLLASTAVSDSVADECLDRGNTLVEVDGLSPGDYWIVVDSYCDDGQELPGPYALRVDFIGYDVWRERVVAQGVVWRQKLYPDLFGDMQTANVIDVDPTVFGVRVAPVQASGCQTTPTVAAAAGGVAAVNGGYFGSGCVPVGMVKIDGSILATNPSNRPARATLGVSGGADFMIRPVAHDDSWPGVDDALGGAPMVVDDGQVYAAWQEEGLSASMNYAHPRTAAGIDGDGHLILVTLDGRTAAGGGVTLDELGQYMSWLGCVDGMNFDGGGSTTMWVAGQPASGVVNYPSDNGEADHFGVRANANSVVVWAEPYNHPPRFTSTPVLTASDGTLYFYDADGLDLNLDDVLTFGLVSGPDGMSVDSDSGETRWTPSYRQGGSKDVVLVLSDGENETEQVFSINVSVADTDGDAMPDAWEREHGLEVGLDDSEQDADGDGYENGEEFALDTDPRDPHDPPSRPDSDGGLDATIGVDGTAADGAHTDAGAPNDSAAGGCGCRARGGASGVPLSFPLLCGLFWVLIVLLRVCSPRE